jgi:hypothetical protein
MLSVVVELPRPSCTSDTAHRCVAQTCVVASTHTRHRSNPFSWSPCLDRMGPPRARPHNSEYRRAPWCHLRFGARGAALAPCAMATQACPTPFSPTGPLAGVSTRDRPRCTRPPAPARRRPRPQATKRGLAWRGRMNPWIRVDVLAPIEANFGYPRSLHRETMRARRGPRGRKTDEFGMQSSGSSSGDGKQGLAKKIRSGRRDERLNQDSPCAEKGRSPLPK